MTARRGIVSRLPVTLRPYTPADEDAAIELWRRTWQRAYPAIDFDARVEGWRARWRRELVPAAEIVIAERDGEMIGFVTLDAEGYLDQFVVAPEVWGSGVAAALMADAKRRAPGGITLLVNTDNARAIRFYERNGFVHTHDDVNPVSGRPVYGMKWVP